MFSVLTQEIKSYGWNQSISILRLKLSAATATFGTRKGCSLPVLQTSIHILLCALQRGLIPFITY